LEQLVVCEASQVDDRRSRIGGNRCGSVRCTLLPASHRKIAAQYSDTSRSDHDASDRERVQWEVEVDITQCRRKQQPTKRERDQQIAKPDFCGHCCFRLFILPRWPPAMTLTLLRVIASWIAYRASRIDPAQIRRES
jgi:hypothetical protein